MRRTLKRIKTKIMHGYLDSFNYFDLINAKIKGKKVVYSHFARVNNFGDQFNKDLVRFYGAELIYTSSYKKSRVSLVGSILGAYLRDFNGIVAGSGFIREGYNRTLNSWDVRMIRGPLSASQCGVDNVFYADPGILSKLVYGNRLKEISINKFDLGIVPHSRDVDFVMSLNWPKNIKIIHPRRKPLEVAKDILRCKNIASSSLHGLIFADSFLIPNIHIKFGDHLIGGLHKFNDYYLGMNTIAEHLLYHEEIGVDHIISQCKIRFTKTYMEKKISRTHDILKNIFNVVSE